MYACMQYIRVYLKNVCPKWCKLQCNFKSSLLAFSAMAMCTSIVLSFSLSQGTSILYFRVAKLHHVAPLLPMSQTGLGSFGIVAALDIELGIAKINQSLQVFSFFFLTKSVQTFQNQKFSAGPPRNIVMPFESSVLMSHVT